jgi:hypothetical protein
MSVQEFRGLEPGAELEVRASFCDEDGKLLFEEVAENGKPWVRRPDGNGGYIANAEGVQRVLWNLPRLRAHLADGRRAGPVYLTEGTSDEAAAEAYAAGKEPKTLDRQEQEARAKKHELGRRAAALSAALDKAGNELARTVAASRDEWAESLGGLAQEAEERLTAALAEAQAAADKLGKARRAREWVESFDAGDAIVGRGGPYNGGILRVNLGYGLRGEQHVATVLKLVEEAVAADAPRPGTRKHKVASAR